MGLCPAQRLRGAAAYVALAARRAPWRRQPSSIGLPRAAPKGRAPRCPSGARATVFCAGVLRKYRGHREIALLFGPDAHGTPAAAEPKKKFIPLISDAPRPDPLAPNYAEVRKGTHGPRYWRVLFGNHYQVPCAAADGAPACPRSPPAPPSPGSRASSAGLWWARRGLHTRATRPDRRSDTWTARARRSATHGGAAMRP